MSEKLSRYDQANRDRAELESIRSKIAAAQARGDSKAANAHFQQEMKIIARQQGGDRPIVGGWPKGFDAKQRTV